MFSDQASASLGNWRPAFCGWESWCGIVLSPNKSGAIASPESGGLAKTGFFRLWIGEASSLAGSQISALALPLIALTLLDASRSEMTLIALSESIAVVAFSLGAGAIADKGESIAVMLWSNWARLGLVAAVPILYVLDLLKLWMLIVVMIAAAGFTLLFDSAMSRYIPELVPKELLIRGNSWMQSTQATGEVGGPTLSGAIVGVIGAPAAMIADAMSYLVSCVMLRSLPRHRPVANADETGNSVTRGFVNVWRSRPLRMTTFAAAHFNFFSSLFFALYLLFLVRDLGYSPLVVGLVYTTGGVGGLVGAAISEHAVRVFGKGTTLAATFTLPGVVAFLLPMSTNASTSTVASVVFAGAFVWSASVVVNVTICETLKQTLVPSHEIGRTTSAVRFMSWGIEILGTGLAALLVAADAATSTLMKVGAFGVALSGAWIIVTRSAFLDDMVAPSGESGAAVPIAGLDDNDERSTHKP